MQGSAAGRRTTSGSGFSLPATRCGRGSDIRWADLNPETDHLIRLRDAGELRACAWVTQRTIRISGRETFVAVAGYTSFA